MTDVRLKKVPYIFDGNIYELCCNMNVLADVQEEYGGEIMGALNMGSVKSLTSFLTAMLNDYADEQGWDKYTTKQVGRKLNPSELKELTELVMGIVTDSILPEGEGDPKNAPATQEKAPTGA